jgi:type VI secretion system protein ImpG
MHEAFTMNTARLWLRMPGDMDRKPLDGYFTALGFGDDDGLWPKGSSSFSGYQLLLEYFTFREKFMFTACAGWRPWSFRLSFRGLKSTWCWRNAGSMTSALPKSICA